ncbi:MAG: ABC transporter substrate-binding protein [Tepidisphaeraceae bacterium]
MKTTMWVWAIGVLVLAAGCGDEGGAKPRAANPGTASAPTPVTLQLNWKPEPQFGGFYALDAHEIDRKHGLDVTITPGGAGAPTIQMIQAGKVDFGIVSADEIVTARSRGGDVVALFAAYQTCPQGLMTHAKRGFKEIGDVFKHEGTVAMERGLTYASLLEKKYGFDKIKIVPSPFGDLTVFRQDLSYTMQCFVTSEPLAATKAGLDPQTFLIADAGYNPYTTVLCTTGQYAKGNPALVKAMVSAVREAWRQYLDDPSRTNSEMEKLNPTMDAQTFKDSAEVQKPLIETDETKQHGLGHMTTERWKTLIDQMVEHKAIDQPVPAQDCFVAPYVN